MLIATAASKKLKQPNIEELLSYSVGSKKNVFAYYFLSLINNDLTYINDKTTANIISLLIIHENIKDLTYFLKCAKNVSFDKNDASSMFSYSIEHLKNNFILFEYSNIVDNLNAQTLERHDIKKMKSQIKISNMVKNF